MKENVARNNADQEEPIKNSRKVGGMIASADKFILSHVFLSARLSKSQKILQIFIQF